MTFDAAGQQASHAGDDPRNSLSDPVAARLLNVSILALRTDILPQIADDATRVRFDQITRLLNSASARLSKRAEGLHQLLRCADPLTNIAITADDARNSSMADLEGRRQKIEQAFTDEIPACVDAVAADPTALVKLERFIALEKDFFLSQDADIATGSQVVYRGGRIDIESPVARTATWPPINEENLSAYLCRRSNRAGIKAISLRTIPGGFSKQTIFFTLLDETTGVSSDLVIRKDMPAPFIDKTVANEFDPLRNLHGLGFPVAKPLWLESDATVFGGCFIVSARVAGSSNVAQWASNPVHARNACKELAIVLATLHRFAPQQLGYSQELALLSAGTLMEREIDHWTRLFHARKSEPLPLQELPLVWLRRNIPQELYARPARIIHGDAGFHNLMFDTNGHVTALLDWEFSGLGDPTQDIGFVRQFVETLMEWREFLDIYLSAGGVAPCPEAEFFFDLWSKTRNCIGCVDARALFDTKMPDEVKFALAGHVFAPYLLVDQCESLIAHLKRVL